MVTTVNFAPYYRKRSGSFRGLWRCLALVALGWTLCQPVSAQLSDSAQVSLITIAPGKAVYSLWGHSAVRVFDPIYDLDVVFNYGTFDFGNTLLFLARFAYGRLDYMLTTQSYPAFIDEAWYAENRQVVEQVLDLTESERDSLFSYLYRNASPENRVYRYDYFYDNCSTRIRDALETVLGDSTLFNVPPSDGSPGLSYRKLVQHFTQSTPILDLLLNIALGLPTDAAPTARGRLFLPDELMRALDQTTIDRKGNRKDLVSVKRVVYGPGAPAGASIPVVPIAWLVCGLGVVLAMRPHRLWHYVDAVLLTVVSIAGLLLIFLWFVSLHDAAGPNLQLAWAWPTHAYFAWAIMHGIRRAWHRHYFLLAAAITLTAAVSAFLLPLPGSLPPILLFISVRWAACAGFLVPRTGFEPVLPA